MSIPRGVRAMDVLSNPNLRLSREQKAQSTALEHALEGMVNITIPRGVRAMDALSNRATA